MAKPTDSAAPRSSNPDNTQHSIPPSRYRRFGDQEREHLPVEADDFEDGASAGANIRRISPTTVAGAAQCLLRAVYRVLKVPAMQPSPFTQESMEDGKHFEKDLCEDPAARAVWVKQLNHAFDLELPGDIRLVKLRDIRLKKSESVDGFCKRNSTVLMEILREEAKAGQPVVFHSVPLSHTREGALLAGTCDLLIWTGSHMILGDIKCSEEARTSHGLQVSHYHLSWKECIGENDFELHPEAFIMHCATGYRYTRQAPEAKRKECIGFTQVTKMNTGALATHFNAHLETLLKADSNCLDKIEESANFIAACTECEFRFHCYPRFLKQQPVSFLPLMRAETASMRALGIHSLERLATIIEAGEGDPVYEKVFNLRERSPMQMLLLKDSVAKARGRNGSCTFRIAPETAEKPLFFVRSGNKTAFFPDPIEPFHTCLVVYTEAERAMAWAKLLELERNSLPGKPLRLPRKTFVLSEEMQEHAHFPIPSLTLKPLAEWCAHFDTHCKNRSTTTLVQGTEWNENKTDEEWRERLQDLRTVWSFLLDQAYEPVSL